MSGNEETEEEWRAKWEKHFWFWEGAFASEDPVIRRRAWITLEAMRIARDRKVGMDTAFKEAIKVYKEVKKQGIFRI